MAEQEPSSPASHLSSPQPEAALPRERYALGYGENVHRWMNRRRAATHASFFIPHLRTGMSLLDCGCGPGSITIDLAEIVAPGEVVGIDIEPLQIERAQASARERGLANVRFAVADVYALPFADATFDAAFAHATLYHLREPLRALREFRRVLKPGGLVGIRDTDYSMWCMEPVTPGLDEARHLSLRVAEHDGASPTYARYQRQFLVEAGFARTEATASCVGSGTLEQTRRSARALLARLRSSSFQQTVFQQAWADRERLDSLCAEVQTWGERPDAFECLIWRAAVGWVTSESVP